ncbi:MAG: cytochrome c family protein [Pseudomonadota bacterium]
MSQSNLLKSGILTISFVTASTLGASALDGDAGKGESLFKRCSSCHMVGEGAKNRVGPILTGVVNRTAATVEGYKYGKSIIAAGEAGLVWTEEEMFDYLLDPKKYLRKKLDNKKAKSKMSFRLKGDQDRADVIAYLKTFSPDIENESASDVDSESEEASTD